MTLCVIDGGHCVCQPEEGVPCIPALNMKAEIERLRAELAEFQVVAYRREWNGDESDFGNWIYAEANERDHIGVWEPVYVKVPKN